MILVIPAGLTATYGRMVGSRRQGWAVFAAMMTLFVVAVALVYAAEIHGTPAMHAAGVSGPEPRGQGAALRHRLLLAVRRGHHGRLVRRGERRDGVAHRPRRRRPDERDHDRRGDLGRGRLGPLRDAAVRHPRRLHLGPDGRPHAGVPRQEGRGARDQAHGHRHDRRADDGAGHDGARDRDASGARRRSTTAVRRASRRRSTPTPRRATTTARRSPATPATSSPTAPTHGAFGITFADLLGGAAMLGGRFLPLLAALAVAGSLAGKRVAPAGLGTLRTDTPTFVVGADLGDPHRRAPDLRPRPAPRTRGPGPDRTSSSSHARDSEPPPSRSSPSASCSGSPTRSR